MTIRRHLGKIKRAVLHQPEPAPPPEPEPEIDPFPIDAWTDPAYAAWFEENRTKEDALVEQCDASFDVRARFSIIVPLYETPLDYLRDMAESVLLQTYTDLELVLVNASPGNEELCAAIDDLAAKDGRVKIVTLEENLGIAENSNKGIEVATGDFVAFLDHDDWIELDTLYRYIEALQQDPDIDLFYCDEDLVEKAPDAPETDPDAEPAEDGRPVEPEDERFLSNDGFYHMHPFFKPCVSPEQMLCKNAIIHMMTIRKDVLDGMPEPDRRFDGAQDYNMVLYALHHARKCHHEARVLYHWRMNEESTANNPDAKPYAKLASRLALQNNYDLEVMRAKAVGSGILNLQNLWFSAPEDAPMVSVVVFGETDSDQAKAFAKWFEMTNSYSPVELVFVCDGSRFASFNAGAGKASGDVLMFMDADSMFQTPEPIEQLLGLLRCEGVGAVAPKTLYSNGCVRSYGTAVTCARVMPLYRGYPDDFPAYQCNLRAFQDYSAASYLGLMVEKQTFVEAGGFDEEFEGEIGTADLCQRIRKMGLRIAHTPTVKLQTDEKCPELHYSNETNAADFTEGDLERFDEKWPGLREQGDPYFNKNLDQASEYFQVDAALGQMDRSFDPLFASSRTLSQKKTFPRHPERWSLQATK